MSAETVIIERADFTSPAQLSDRDQAGVTLLYNEFYSGPGGYANAGEYASRLDPAADTLYTVTVRGQVVGAAEVRHGDDEISTEIVELVVRRDSRGRGHARRLVQYIAQQAVQAEHLFVRTRPARNATFAERLGFAAVGADEGDQYSYALAEELAESPRLTD